MSSRLTAIGMSGGQFELHLKCRAATRPLHPVVSPLFAFTSRPRTSCSEDQLLCVVIAARNNHEVCFGHAINQAVFVIDSS